MKVTPGINKFFLIVSDTSGATTAQMNLWVVPYFEIQTKTKLFEVTSGCICEKYRSHDCIVTIDPNSVKRKK